jgi:hypothetical protein
LGGVNGTVFAQYTEGFESDGRSRAWGPGQSDQHFAPLSGYLHH